MNDAYLITGGNIGTREEHLVQAAKHLQHQCGPVIDRSSMYETEPWGKQDQDPFLNQAIVIQTRLGVRELLAAILQIEATMGRSRKEKNGARIIDIDIIFFNHVIVSEPGLVVPHPEMSNRRFVLTPLAEVIPAYIHPVHRRTVKELLDDCTDPLQVKKYNSV